jgi:hypothetical protein
MRVCWWPATAREPQTCATFAVVQLFRILNCQGKLSAHDFLRSLEFLSNNDGQTPVHVRIPATKLNDWRLTACAFRIIVVRSATLCGSIEQF